MTLRPESWPWNPLEATVSREIARRLSKLEARRIARTLRTLLIVYQPGASEEQIEAMVQERLRGVPDHPTPRVVLIPDQYETPEAWEAAAGGEA